MMSVKWELEENEAQTVLNALNHCATQMGVTQVMEFNELVRISQKLAKQGIENGQDESQEATE